MFKILIIPLLIITVSCSQSDEISIGADISQIPTPTPEEVPTDNKVNAVEKHSTWIINNDVEKIIVESVGWCKILKDRRRCDYFEITLVSQGENHFIAKREVQNVDNYSVLSTSKENFQLSTEIIWNDIPEFFTELENFEKSKNSLSDEKVEMSLTDEISFEKYRMGVAAQHYYDNGRCKKSKIAQQFSKICPLNMGNINLVNSSMDILAGISNDIRLALEVSVTGEIKSLATYFLNNPFIRVGTLRTNWHRRQPSYQLIPTQKELKVDSINPFYKTLQASYRNICSANYDELLYGLSVLRGPTLPYLPQLRPELEEKVSKITEEDFLSANDDTYYSNNFGIQFGHIFRPEFWNRYLPETPHDFVENKLYLGGPCEDFFNH